MELLGQGIAVDSAGNAYVTGRTGSTEATFPVTVGPDLTFNGGFEDAFVAKVNPSGTALLYAGYIGGSHSENRSKGGDIAVDSAGNAYVTGTTDSSESDFFPVMVGPDLDLPMAAPTYVAKVTLRVRTSYTGYIGREFSRGIAVDSAALTWYTTSSSTFPVTWAAAKYTFLAKVNVSGTALVYAGYIGGSINENNSSPVESTGGGIAVDSAGNAYVTGNTNSSESDFFPVTVGPDLTCAPSGLVGQVEGNS